MDGNTMYMQKLLKADGNYAEIDEWLTENGIQRVFLVCDGFISSLKIGSYFEGLERRTGVRVVRFSGYQPNPDYGSVVEGLKRFRQKSCDAVIAVGGGSAMDVAKCVKLYANMDPNKNYLEQPIVPNDIPLLAVPTTAGTGSEATRFAVIYYKGEKQSVSHESCIPSAVLLDPSVLGGLPEYQRKATALDALCHAVESFWSINSTRESRAYSRDALRSILDHLEGYLKNRDADNAGMQQAAYLAGKAINLTQTTAGHAMCYKLTSLYGIAHGHAAALCAARLWPYMLNHLERCADPRGRGYLEHMFLELADAMGCDMAPEAAIKFEALLTGLGLEAPETNVGDLEILQSSVNLMRLKNNPVALDNEALRRLYEQILIIK